MPLSSPPIEPRHGERAQNAKPSRAANFWARCVTVTHARARISRNTINHPLHACHHCVDFSLLALGLLKLHLGREEVLGAKKRRVSRGARNPREVLCAEEVMAKHKTVRDVMTRDPITLPPSASLFDAATTMRERGIGDVVVAGDEELIGIVTDRDIVVRGLAEGRDPNTTTLTDITSRELITVSPDDPIETAVRLIREHAIRRLPVMSGGRIVGIVTLGDLALEQDRGSALADVSAAPSNE
jgi:CBS domain-containing protein